MESGTEFSNLRKQQLLFYFSFIHSSIQPLIQQTLMKCVCGPTGFSPQEEKESGNILCLGSLHS